MALMAIIETANLEQLEEFLARSSGQIKQEELDIALSKAAFYGDIDIVKLLIRYSADVNARNEIGTTPLDSAIENMHFRVVEFLVNSGANINSRDAFGVTPLHRAVDVEIEESKALQEFPPSTVISSFLFSNNASKDAKDKNGRTPLDWAIMGQHIKAMAMFQTFVE